MSELVLKKSTLYLVGILLIIIIGGYVMVQGKAPSNGGGAFAKNNGEFQEVVVGMKNYNYYPNTVTVKAGVPVRMSLDNSVSGCFRDLALRDFGIRKYLPTPNDYVEFTPEKPGTYRFACSMGMGYGNLVVE